MELICWNPAFDTGLDEIDNQHKQLIQYLNDLTQAMDDQDTLAVKGVITGIVDYTLSHFAFEETLMMEAKYPYAKAHKSVHEMFIKRVSKFQNRLESGEDIKEELHGVLKGWLIQHIQRDDAAYVKTLKGYIEQINAKEDADNGAVVKKRNGWLGRLAGKYFG
ncbi:bacteriohemerythrin [Desulfogranum japonicum]|uniref:bacteriohemerythrin n=1 Tax=Desulfogranum japonicum TaxID=231447 RepID=UPI000409E566|nr:bacteriohemerythrin [Desulfogranum japonicum]